jgi:CBS domain containing-hemolysin-like protein
MSEHLELYWAALVVCLVLTAFFNASETALVSLGKVRLRQIKGRHPRLGPLLERVASNPDRLLSTILLGNTVVTAGASSSATALAITLAPQHPVLIATVAVTVLLLLTSEITPKVLAATYTERIALFVVQPVDILIRLFSPLVRVFSAVPRALLWALGGHEHKPAATSEDIKTMAVLGREEGVLGQAEQEMIHSVVEFGSITVSQIMVPRVEIESVADDLPLEEVLDLVVETGHARIPVYHGSIDQVVGILYARDLLVAWRNRQLIILRDLLRPPLFVSETMKVRDLFRELHHRREHLAVVVDEYGGTAGLVTLNDVVGEIVGEVVEEHRDAHDIAPRKDGSLLVSGQIAIDELNAKAGLSLPEEEFQTLSGLLVDHLGRVPYPGEEIRLAGAAFQVLDADHRRIYRLSLRKP